MFTLRIFSSFVFLLSIFSIEAMQTYVAAGVTPFAVNPKDSKVYLLVGWDRAKNAWNSFGGRRERGETDARVTAAREGAEEMMLILDNDASFRNLLRTKNVQSSQTYRDLYKNLKDEYKTIARGPSYGWFVEISYDKNLSSKFTTRYSEYTSAPFDWREFNRIQWVPLDTILAVFDSGQRLEKLSGEAIHGGFAAGLARNRSILKSIQQKFAVAPPAPKPASVSVVPAPTPTVDPLQQSLDALRQALEALKAQLAS